jgi:mRNA interferase HigB
MKLHIISIRDILSSVVISRKALRQFWELHPDSESALVRWFAIMQRHDFTSLEALGATFPTADKVGGLIVFNIAGNKYRLIAAIHFNRRKVYIRHVLTHHDYDRGAWKT